MGAALENLRRRVSTTCVSDGVIVFKTFQVLSYQFQAWIKLIKKIVLLVPHTLLLNCRLVCCVLCFLFLFFLERHCKVAVYLLDVNCMSRVSSMACYVVYICVCWSQL